MKCRRYVAQNSAYASWILGCGVGAYKHANVSNQCKALMRARLHRVGGVCAHNQPGRGLQLPEQDPTWYSSALLQYTIDQAHLTAEWFMGCSLQAAYEWADGGPGHEQPGKPS